MPHMRCLKERMLELTCWSIETGCLVHELKRLRLELDIIWKQLYTVKDEEGGGYE